MAAPLYILCTSIVASVYQGTSLRSPFFFLLVDSFLASLLSPFCAGVASVLAASVACPVPAVASDPPAGAVPLPIAESLVAGLLGSTAALSGSAVGAGELGSGCAPELACAPVRRGGNVFRRPARCGCSATASRSHRSNDRAARSRLPRLVSTRQDVRPRGTIGFRLQRGLSDARSHLQFLPGPGLEESHRFPDQAGTWPRCVLLRRHPSHRFRIRLWYRRFHRL